MRINFNSILYNILVLAFVIAFCEYFIYKISIALFCDWPAVEESNKPVVEETKTLKLLLVADPHLLGPARGHWLDKLRREWQMKMSFQSAFTWLQPDYVVILGDLFDEGETVNEKDWNDYLYRFYDDIFYMEDKEKLIVIAGNHDIGFHHTVLRDIAKWRRFQNQFKMNSSVDMFSLLNVTFITINSMSLKQDVGCEFCEETSTRINELSTRIPSNENSICSCQQIDDVIHCKNNHPIILQHFPLYREDESECVKFADGPSLESARKKNKESWDVISKESTEYLLEKVKPCILISGHTHHGCFLNRHNVFELSVPSLSWRNINNPSVTMVVFHGNNVAISKCLLPRESTVIAVYLLTAMFLVIFNLTLTAMKMKSRPNISKRYVKLGPDRHCHLE